MTFVSAKGSPVGAQRRRSPGGGRLALAVLLTGWGLAGTLWAADGQDAPPASTDQVQRQLKRLATQVETLTGKLAVLTEKVMVLEEEKKDLAVAPPMPGEGTATAPAADLAALRQEREKLVAHVAQLKQECDALKARSAALEQEKAGLGKQVGELTVQLAQLKEGMADLAAKTARLEGDKRLPSLQISELEAARRQLTGEVARLEMEKKTAEQKVAELEKANQTLAAKSAAPPVPVAAAATEEPARAAAQKLAALEAELKVLREQAQRRQGGEHPVIFSRLDFRNSTVTCLWRAPVLASLAASSWEWVAPVGAAAAADRGRLVDLIRAPVEEAPDAAGKALYLVRIRMDQTQYCRLAAQANLRQGRWPEDVLEIRARTD